LSVLHGIRADPAGRAASLAIDVTLTYIIDPGQRLITILGEYAGREEWKALLSQVLHDPRYQPRFCFLRDLRAATTPADAATVVGVMETWQSFWDLLQPTRVAVLTSREVDTAALTAHAWADAAEMPLKVFHSYQDAIQWLMPDAGPADHC
jgi:hypothetical protein